MLVQTLNRRKYLVLETDPAGEIVKTLQKKKFSYIVLPEKCLWDGEFVYNLVSIPKMDYDTPELKEEFERRFQYNQIMEVLKSVQNTKDVAAANDAFIASHNSLFGTSEGQDNST